MGANDVSILSESFICFYESKGKGLKTPKNAVRKPNEAGKSSNQSNPKTDFSELGDY